MIANSKRAFSVSEAARQACVSRGIIEYWLTCGLPFEELPGTGEKNKFRRIRRDDLDAFLESYYQRSRAGPQQEPRVSNRGELTLLPRH